MNISHLRLLICTSLILLLGLPSMAQTLEAEYNAQLDSLRNEIIEALPKVNEELKTSFLNARTSEVKAQNKLKDAEKKMGEIQTAKALVGHAKGKWIGGANRGIENAKAKRKKATTDKERESAEQELAKWILNKKDGEQALKERQAKLDTAELNRPQVEKALKSAAQELVTAKANTVMALKKLNLTDFLTNDQLDGKLAKYVVLLEASPRKLAAFAGQSDESKKLIDTLLRSEKLLIQMVTADGAVDGNYGEAMLTYSKVLKTQRNRFQQANSLEAEVKETLQKLALAVSLELAKPIQQRNAIADTVSPTIVDPVKRYLHYEKAFLANELDPAFKSLSVWDYRMVVNGKEPDEILKWGREMLRNYRPDHITTSDYRWRYVAIVRSDIQYGSGDNKYDKPELQFFQNILMNGGVCGRRAFFGRFMLRAFGVPTTARPSRGHAALAHWTPDGWVVCLGGGWGAGWTKTRYDRDLDFLATTQARATGDHFLQVKRAQWVGDLLKEIRVFGLQSSKELGFWNAVSLYTQKSIITDSRAKALAAVGEDIGEANETKEKVEIHKLKITDKDRSISIDSKGVITIPAAATSNPTKSNGKIILMMSQKGGKQLHYSRTGKNQAFTYTFNAPAGKYQLTAKVVTPSWKQQLQLSVNAKRAPVEAPITIPLPFTVGMWGMTDPVEVTLLKGSNTFTFTRSHQSLKGVTIKEFTLTPIK